ncbi:MAG: TetR/AcrR family transcriptional regulator C-terminal domain-containing protein [Firmicutes bacterium]|nr:TetR/AcrR family transcriptional regulator C-terminal domain-containing protein [Bacillota bacterium]
MKKKPVQKISIRELTQKANINRQTFYYHFKDIYDCIQWMYREEAISVLEQKTSEKKWQDGLLELFNYADKNREVALCAVNSLGRRYVKEAFFENIKKLCDDFIAEFKESTHSENEMEKNKEYIEFLSQYYTTALAAVLESYLLGEWNKTPEEIIALLSRTIKDHIAGACERLNIEPGDFETID